LILLHFADFAANARFVGSFLTDSGRGSESHLFSIHDLVVESTWTASTCFRVSVFSLSAPKMTRVREFVHAKTAPFFRTPLPFGCTLGDL
jgi:hypothetical protein